MKHPIAIFLGVCLGTVLVASALSLRNAAIGGAILLATALAAVVIDRGFPSLLLAFGVACVRLANRMQRRHLAAYQAAWANARSSTRVAKYKKCANVVEHPGARATG